MLFKVISYLGWNRIKCASHLMMLELNLNDESCKSMRLVYDYWWFLTWVVDGFLSASTVGWDNDSWHISAPRAPKADKKYFQVKKFYCLLLTNIRDNKLHTRALWRCYGGSHTCFCKSNSILWWRQLFSKSFFAHEMRLQLAKKDVLQQVKRLKI